MIKISAVAALTCLALGQAPKEAKAQAPTPTTAPTPSPTPIRPIVDLNGPNADGTTGQDNPNANGIDFQNVYFEGGGPQVVDPPATVLSDISAQPIDSNFIGAKLVEARIKIAPFANDPNVTAPDNRGGRNDIEVLDVNKVTRDMLSGQTFRFVGQSDVFIRYDTGISIAYDNNSQTLTLKGGTSPDFINGAVVNKLDFIRESYEIALRGVTYENKFFRGNTDVNLNRQPNQRNRFITYIVDTDNDDTNNIDNRFVPQEPGNPKQSKPATATLIIGEKQSLIVTTLNDVVDPKDGLTSLREAMQFANTDTKDSAITFAPGLVSATSPGTISLNSSLPFLQERNQPFANPLPVIKTSITGPGPRLLNIQANGKGTFTTFGDALAISGLSITKSGGVGIATFEGDLTVDRCMITGGSDDGIDSFTSANAPNNVANAASVLTVTNCSIANNRGYGINTTNSRTANKATTITNTTVSGNFIGLSVISHQIKLRQAPPQMADPTTVSLSTFTRNSLFGIEASSNAEITITNTISSGGSNDDVRVDGAGNGGNDIDGRFITKDGNLVGSGNAIAQFTGAADQKGVDPLLGPLSNNGGDSDTHNLRAGSPARDKGVAITGTAPATDQRGTGFPRVVGTVDIGAYEAQPTDASFTVTISPRNPNQNTTLTATATGTNNDGTAITPLFYRFLINGNEVQASNNNTLNLAGRGLKNNDVITVIVARNQAGTNDATAPQATDSVTASVVIVNSAPNLTSVTLAPDPPTTNQTLTATARANDPEGDPITYTYTWKVNGTVVKTNTTTANTNTLDLSVQGNGNRGDTVSVEVTATDNKGAKSPVRTASTVVANSAPSVQNVDFTATIGQQSEVLLTGNDPDGDPIVFSLVTAPTQGTAQITINNDGRYVLFYTPNANAMGTDSLTFMATDNNTAATGAPSNAKTSAPGTANITIVGTTPTPTPTPTTPPDPTPTPGPTPTPTPDPNPTPTPTPDPNRPPVVVDTSINATREVPVSKGLGVFDPDPGDNESNITLKRSSGPRKGTGEIRRDTDGKWKLFYKASGLYTGNDEVKFFAIDSKGAVSNVATITINLFNTAPTARSTEMQVAAGGSADVGIFGQDVDRDVLFFKSVGGPSKGTGEFRKDVNGNTRFFYQNSQVAVGDDEVKFVAIDTSGKPSEVAILKIKVIGVFNRPPVANNVSGTTVRNTPVNVTVSGSDPDDANLPEGQTTPLTYKRVGGPTNGTGEIQLFNDGTYKMSYTPRSGFVGTETIRYVAIDDKGKPSKPATITITVTAPTPTPPAPNALRSGPAPSAGNS